MKLKLCLILMLLLAVSRLDATGEQEVFIDEVVAKTLGHGIQVTLTNSMEGKARILIQQRGEKIEVPAAILQQIDEIIPGSVKILTHRPNGDPIPDDWLEKHEFIVSFDYGETELHGTKDETIEVQSRGRLHFRDKKFAYFEWMIPEGDHKNRWRIYRNNAPPDDSEPTVVERMLAPRK